MSKFLLNAEGGHFVFKKEADAPDWSTAVHRQYKGAGEVTADLPALGDAACLDVREVRSAVVLLKPQDDTFVYDFMVYAGLQSSIVPDWYFMDGGDYSAQEGNLLIGVDCRGVEYLYILATSSSATKTLDIEMAVIPYDE